MKQMPLTMSRDERPCFGYILQRVPDGCWQGYTYALTDVVLVRREYGSA